MKKNIKNKKHGFTLVELLVVIAILAILASVSVVGYLSFTTRAKNSNAVTELTQARDLIRGEFLEEDEHHYLVYDSTNEASGSTPDKSEENNTAYNLTFTYNASETNKERTFVYNRTDVVPSDNTTLTDSQSKYTKDTSSTSIKPTWDKVLKLTYTELSTLGGTFYVNVSDNKIASIAYVSATEGYALWTISNDEIVTSDSKSFTATNTIELTKIKKESTSA